MDLSKVHKKGTTLFSPVVSWSRIPGKCPVCNGTTRVVVVPENAEKSDGIVMGCSYCQYAEREGLKKGHVVIGWEWQPRVHEFRVEGVRIEDKGDKIVVKYTYNVTSCSCNLAKHEDTFTSREEAFEQAEKECEEQRNIERNKEKINGIPRSELLKSCNNPTWSAGDKKKRLRECKKAITNLKKDLETATENYERMKNNVWY